jgi:hypothetical protein
VLIPAGDPSAGNNEQGQNQICGWTHTARVSIRLPEPPLAGMASLAVLLLDFAFRGNHFPLHLKT